MKLDFKNAKFALSKQKKDSNIKLCLIKENAPNSLNCYKQIVCFYKANDYDQFVTLEIPLTKEEIKEEESRGSLLTTRGTIVGVPKKYILPVEIF